MADSYDEAYSMYHDSTQRNAIKKAESEARRLESLKRKIQLEKHRQALISQALKNVDTVGIASRKIVFQSDSDDEQSIAQNRDENKSKGVALFEGDGEENGDDLKLSISNRHFGTKGAKLMVMEAKFGNDERFRMNEKFLDDSSEEEEDAEEVRLENEKKEKLEILSKVLGKRVRNTRPVVGAVRNKRAAPFSRFDPDNPDHIRWLQEQNLQNAKDEEGECEEKSGAHGGSVCEEREEGSHQNEDEGSRTVDGYYFDVDEDFAEALKKSLKVQDQCCGSSNKTQNGFSFLKSIGRIHSSDEETDREKPMSTSSFNGQPSLVEQKGAYKMDVKDELPEGGSEERLLREAKGSPMTSADGSFFFITDTDREVADAVEHFRRKQSIEALSKHWSSIRTSIIKIYKGQRKEALRRKKEQEGWALKRQFSEFQENGKAQRNLNCERGNENPSDVITGGDERNSSKKEPPSMGEISENRRKSDGRSRRKKRRITAVHSENV